MSKKNKQHHIKPSSEEPKSDTSTWPLLLKNISTLITRANYFTLVLSLTHQQKDNIRAFKIWSN